MRRPRLFILSVVSLVIILSVVQVGVSNSLSTSGATLGELEQTVKSYKKENTLLKQELLTISSFTQIASKASEMGFVRGKEQVFIEAPQPLASR